MSLKRFMLGPAEYRLIAVGAYSLAAFSAAALIEILSAGPIDPAVHTHLARVGFAAVPLLAGGLALDYYCTGRPRMRVFAGLLCAGIGALMGTTVSSFGAILGVYSPASAVWIGYGFWLAIAIVVVSVAASWSLDADRYREE